MKKLKYLLFLFTILLITDVNAEVINGSASIASGVIYDGSYGFTPNITLQDNNENVYRYSSDYVDPFIMGSRYVAGVNLGSTGANSFSGVVQIPVAIYSLNNVTLYNRVSASNFHIGLSNTFYDWNLTPTVTNFTSNCSVYYNTTTSSPYNICLYTINFTANSSSMIYGGTNFSFSLYDWNTPSNLVFQPLGGSWGNNYGGWIFPKNPTNIEGASNIAPTFILSYGNNVSETLLDQQIQQQQTIINQNQTIINQQNQNTQDIINNQDNNTQDIIDNQNQNTQQQIESQKVCKYIDKNYVIQENAVMNNGNGNVILNQTGWGVTDFIKLGSSLTVVEAQATGQGICYYNINKTFISCEPLRNYSSNSIVNVPTNASYFRSTILLSSGHPTFNLCSDGNQALNDSVNDLNDNITNSNTDNPSSDFSNFQNMLPENGVITQLITLPISLFQKILTSLNSSCSNFNLGSLYNHELILPCINISNYVGSSLWNVIDILFSGFFVLVIAKKMIATFENFSSMKEGDILD